MLLIQLAKVCLFFAGELLDIAQNALDKASLSRKNRTDAPNSRTLDGTEQDFQIRIASLALTRPTQTHILRLYQHLGDTVIFTRRDVMRMTGLTHSPASTLIRKMKDAALIERTHQAGRGCYRFCAATVCNDEVINP